MVREQARFHAYGGDKFADTFPFPALD